LGELNKLQSQYLGKVFDSAILVSQDLIPTQVIPEIDNSLLNGEFKAQKQKLEALIATEEPLTQIQTLMDRTGLLAQTRAAITAVKKQAVRETPTNVFNRKQIDTQNLPTILEVTLSVSEQHKRRG
jgi:hypothetical protein